MALPQANQNPKVGTDNPYQHLGRERSSAPGWSWKLFNFSIIILIIVVVIYLGIQIGYKPFLNAQIDSLDDQLAEFESKISAEDQDAFIGFYSQIVYLKEILDNHVFFSPFFELLERNTHTGIFFSDIDYELSEGRITLEGRADTFESLGQQLKRFDNVPEISRSILSESQSIEGQIGFRIVIYPSPSLLTVEKVSNQGSVGTRQGTAQQQNVSASQEPEKGESAVSPTQDQASPSEDKELAKTKADDTVDKEQSQVSNTE